MKRGRVPSPFFDGMADSNHARSSILNARILWYRLSPSSDTAISAFASPGGTYGMGLSDEDMLLQELSSKTGESPEEVIRKALALYKAATDAVEQGKSVGIAGDPSHLEIEFVGF